MAVSRAGIAILLIPGLMGGGAMKPPVEKENEEGYSHGGRKRRRRRQAGGSAIGEMAPVRLDKRPRSMGKKQSFNAPMGAPSASVGAIGKPSMSGAGMPMMAGGGRLTASERQSLPKSDFALPGHGEGPKGAGSGSYPIPDESHGRNALARVSQHGTPEEKERVRAAVHRKFPDIG